jgi:hypothetical protein
MTTPAEARTRRRGVRTSPWLVTVALALALLGVTACSGADDLPADPPPGAGQKIAPSLVALFRQTLQRDDLSEFEREVINRAIATGRLSQADYEEAHSRYARCIKDSGVVEVYEKLPNGVYEPRTDLSGATDAEADAARKRYEVISDRCLDGMFVVETLYQTQQGNPDLLVDTFEVAVRCLVKAGLAPVGYTAADLKADVRSRWTNTPYDVNDPQAHTCLWSAGFSVNTSGKGNG